MLYEAYFGLYARRGRCSNTLTPVPEPRAGKHNRAFQFGSDLWPDASKQLTQRPQALQWFLNTRKMNEKMKRNDSWWEFQNLTYVSFWDKWNRKNGSVLVLSVASVTLHMMIIEYDGDGLLKMAFFHFFCLPIKDITWRECKYNKIQCLRERYNYYKCWANLRIYSAPSNNHRYSR